MKELNKLIEGIAWPVKYDNHGVHIIDSDGKMICEVRGWGWISKLAQRDFEADEMQDELGNLIAHALNNLPEIEKLKAELKEAKEQAEVWGNAACNAMDSVEELNNLQPKEGEQPVSGERTGEEGVDWIDQMERYGLHRETCSRLSATPFTAKEWLESEGITTPPERE